MDKSAVEFEIQGEKYNVIKHGMAQAKQVASATRWLSKYGSPAFKKFSEGEGTGGGFEMVVTVLSTLDEYALVDLFQLVFGCSQSVAEEGFDFVLLIDGVAALYNESPMIRKLADRFFSQAPSEDFEDSNSTQSEEPMDG